MLGGIKRANLHLHTEGQREESKKQPLLERATCSQITREEQ